MTLNKGIYGLETDSKKTPFGLLNGQLRLRPIIKTASWFNKNGERLGTGDLSMKDLKNISETISSNEEFIILSELCSRYDIPSNADATELGRNYCLQNCSWLVRKNKILRPKDRGKSEDLVKNGISYTSILRLDLLSAKKAPRTEIDNEIDKLAEEIKKLLDKSSVVPQSIFTIPQTINPVSIPQPVNATHSSNQTLPAQPTNQPTKLNKKPKTLKKVSTKP